MNPDPLHPLLRPIVAYRPLVRLRPVCPKGCIAGQIYTATINVCSCCGHERPIARRED